MAINNSDAFVVEEEESNEEEFIEIPNTGIDGYIRPILFSADSDPEEIINLNAGNLRVDENAYISGNVGVGTTNPTSKLHIVGDTLIAGITTVGLGTTSAPSNSQLTFELTSDTNLRIKVRGTDGVLRSANITLA